MEVLGYGRCTSRGFAALSAGASARVRGSVIAPSVINTVNRRQSQNARALLGTRAACQPALGGKGAVATPQERRSKATFYRAGLGVEGDGA